MGVQPQSDRPGGGFVGQGAGAFLLASSLVSYPDEGFGLRVAALLDDPAVLRDFDAAAPEAWRHLRGYLQDILGDRQAQKDLCSLYVDTFERARPVASLYSSEYGLGRSLAKGQDLLDVATYYRSFGFEMGDASESREIVDHLGVELEFYGLLVLKRGALIDDGDGDGVAIVDAARQRFMHDHLGGFPGALLTRDASQKPKDGDGAPVVMFSPFYRDVLQCVTALVRRECDILGVEPLQKQWLESSLNEEDEVTCGTGGCLGGNPEVRSHEPN